MGPCVCKSQITRSPPASWSSETNRAISYLNPSPIPEPPLGHSCMRLPPARRPPSSLPLLEPERTRLRGGSQGVLQSGARGGMPCFTPRRPCSSDRSHPAEALPAQGGTLIKICKTSWWEWI